MIALFGAIYVLVGYLNAGTSISASERVTLPSVVPTPTQRQELGLAAAESTPTTAREIPTSTPLPRLTQTVAVQEQATTSAVEPTATPRATATAEPTAIPSATATPDPTATPEPTAPPSPTATEAPTATPNPPPASIYAASPTPTAVPPTPTASAVTNGTAQVIQRVSDAEKQVKSGRIEATFESAQSNDSTSNITFDFGDAANPPRMHFISTYSSADGQRTTELTAIGERFWERVDQGAWVETGAREGVWGQVQSYLPGVPGVSSSLTIRVDGNRLAWTDPERGVDVTLIVDLETGVPQELRRESRSSNTVVIVTYKDWNAPVDIQIPAGT